MADDALQALRNASPDGLTRTAIRDLLGRNKNADRIGVALNLLASRGLASVEHRKTGGRPVETWLATERKRRTI